MKKSEISGENIKKFILHQLKTKLNEFNRIVLIEFDIFLPLAEVKTRLEIRKMAKSLLFLFVLSSVTYLACGHVALTFPPARKYDLDFLDNSRTPSPCGMPKGKQFNIFGQSRAFICLRFGFCVPSSNQPA